MTTTGTKRAVSTRRILEESIKDIEAGLWTCGDLTCPAYDIPGSTKPMGCALGLVGINAGLCEFKEFNDVIYAVDLDYPKVTWPKSALKAVELLAQTTRFTKKVREQIKTEVDAEIADGDTDDSFAIPFEQGIVWRYNDRGGKNGNELSKQQALNWFKRALALLDT